MLTERDIACLAALARLEIIGARQLSKLLSVFGSPAALLSAPPGQLTASGLRDSTVRRFIEARKGAEPEKESELIYKEGISAVSLNDPAYPAALREIADPPLILFVRGRIKALSEDPSIAVVGTRRMTDYGRAAVRLLVPDLASAGVAVASGLAMGIDAEAHAAALAARGTTVAVLGSGVDRRSVGPRCNARLSELIAENGGALVSEYPPGMPGAKHRFPLRNRIIAGLCRGTLVVEADEKSGALITARAALDCNRDVFAVPGPITHRTSRGVNSLIARGAIPVMDAADILEHCGVSRPDRTEAAVTRPTDPTADRVLEALARAPQTVDEIVRSTGFAASVVLAAISLLEIDGLIEKSGQKYAEKIDTPRRSPLR